MEFIKNLQQDEIRDGWLVKSDKKKVWQRQLEIWQEVDRICRKHKITYWAGYGTLIGAARHGGFIPWDDDVDLIMMRPDFNRFCEVVDNELAPDGVFEVGLKIFSNFRLAHSQTTLIAAKDSFEHKSGGLMIEIFPLDCALDGTRESFFAVNAINELLGTVYNYPVIVEHVQNGGMTVNDWSVIETLHALDNFNEQCEFLNIFAEGVFDCSSMVNWIEEYAKDKKSVPFKKSWFRETIYLPFETIELPAPIDYDKVLTCYYGDWRKPVIDRRGKLGFIHSADIPYKEFLKRIDLKLIFPDIEKYLTKD